MELWDCECRRLAAARETDAPLFSFQGLRGPAKCADCGSERVIATKKETEDVVRMVCQARHHEFWFVRGAPCRKCGCEWTDSSKCQKQLRKADEAATVTVVCMRGCTVRTSS